MNIGGDDIGAVVIDIGTHTTKVGMAGDGSPRTVIPTCVALPGVAAASAMTDGNGEEGKARWYAGDRALFPRDNYEVVSPVTNGIISNFAAAEKLFEHIFTSELRIDPKEHPILICDRSFNPPSRRKKLAEMLFETFQVPAIYLARSPVLAAFAMGKTSALVLDAGAGVTSAVPVRDGYVLHRGVRKTKMAGNIIDEELRKVLLKDQEVIPQYRTKRGKDEKGRRVTHLVDRPGVSASLHSALCQNVVRDMKEQLARVTEYEYDATVSTNIPVVPYELPDGNILNVGIDKFAAPELLFKPGSFTLPSDLDDHRNFKFQGISGMVATAIQECDVDLTKELYGNIIVTGGTSLIPGFAERLAKDLNNGLSPALRTRIHTPNTKMERLFGIWVGGSILGSLGTFHQMWVSKAEFEEGKGGADILSSKCP